MKPDPDYPRMMFHRTKSPVTVYSRDEEQLLGGEWSRTIAASLPREEKPVKPPDPEPDEEPDEDEEPLPEDPAEPEPKVAMRRPAPPAAPKAKGQAQGQAKRGRPAAHKAPAHKRKA